MMKTFPRLQFRVGLMKQCGGLRARAILFGCCLLLLQCASLISHAQCSGSLGQPIFIETFDSAATNVRPTFGAALGTGITNYPYYSPANNPTQATGPNQGQYTICNTTHGYKNTYFVDRGDHTSNTGRGYMMVVDANKNPGKFYDRTITGLCAGTTFEFSAWIMNINPNTAPSNSRPSLRFVILNSLTNDTLGSIATGTVEYVADSTKAWVRQAVTFSLPLGVSSVKLQIISNTPNDSGNDLALDDIAFAPCGPMISFSQPDTVCTGSTAHLRASVPVGSYLDYYFQLQSSPTGAGTFTNVGTVVHPGSNIANFTVANAQTGFDYRVLAAGGLAEVSNTRCRAVSPVLNLYVYGTPSTATVGADQELCANTSATITGNTPTTGKGGWSLVSGPTTPVFDTTLSTTTITGLQTGTYTFRWSIRSGNCAPSTADVKVVVDAALAGNTITAPGTVTFCGGADAGVITGSTPTGGNGAYAYQWQSSSDGVTFTDISGSTAASYDPPNATVTTYYRRAVTSGPCTTRLYSNVVVITMQPVLGGNTITAPATILYCGSGDPGVIGGSAPTGGSGTYSYQWQTSTDNINWTTLPGIATATYDPPSTGVTTYYRRLVSSGACTVPNASNAVKITVTATLTAGAIDGSGIYCGSSGTVGLTETAVATGGSGTYSYQWQSSTTSASAGFSDIAGATSNTYTVPSLTQTTYYRRVVQGVPCPDATSNVVTITVNPPLAGGTVGNNQAFCVAGDPNTFTETAPATGGNGTYAYQWQRSTTSATAGFADIPGATGPTYDEPSIAQTTYYRRTVSSNGCADVTSNVITVTINDGIDNNTISADQQICSGVTPATILGSVPTGSIGTYTYLWQQKVSGGFTTAPGTNNGRDYSPGTLTQTTLFRRIVTSGPCTGDVSNTVQVSVTPPATTANAGPDQGPLTVNYASLNGNAPTNGTGTWGQVSGPNTANIVNSAGNATGVTGLVPGTYVFRWTISNAPCTLSTDDVTITVNAPPVANDDVASTNEDNAVNVPVTANDADPDGSIDNSTVTIITQPVYGILTVNGDGTITYTPNGNYNGPDAFTYTVKDNLGAVSNPAQVKINVIAMNDPPLAVDDYINLLQEQPITVPANGILSNDSDPDGDQLTSVALTQPAHGTVTLNSDGSLTYTPDNGFFGTDQFDYKACDPSNSCSTATVYFNVGHVNHPPVANHDVFNGNEDQPLTVQPAGVLGNDTDADNDPLSATLLTQPAHGTLTFNNDGSFTYVPDADFNGVDQFTYKACDASGACSQSVATLNIAPVNDAPVAVDDNYNMDEDGRLNLPAKGVLQNDSDVDGDALTATVVGPTTHGALQLNADGSFTYVPNAFYTGIDIFTYQACDPGGLCDTATVTITINPVQDTATAVDDHYTTPENQPLDETMPGVLTNDSVKHGTTLTANQVDDPLHGTLQFRNDGSFTYTPNDYFTGVDSFHYSACSSRGNCDTATVFITVTSVNFPPVANDDNFTIAEDSTLVAKPGTLTINDSDPNGDALTTTMVTNVQHGTLTVNGDGSFTYAPAANFNGIDTFRYKACDPGGLCDTALVTLTVTPVNDPPQANPDDYTTNEDIDLNIPAPGVLANDTDVDGDVLNAGMVLQPLHGTITLNGDGSFVYHPYLNYNGTDSFYYRACDGLGACDTAVVHITLVPVNDTPVAANDHYALNEDTPLVVNSNGVLFNDSDPDGDPLTAVVVAQSLHGTVILNGDGTFTYTPAPYFNGTDSFYYRGCDPTGACDTATVLLTVVPVNNPPIANPDSYTTTEDVPLTVAAPGALTNDTDMDGDALSAKVVDAPLHGVLQLNTDGSFTYTPVLNFNGVDSFHYAACDPPGLCDTTTVVITVTPVNDAPITNGDAYTTDENVAIDVAAPGILFNDTDADGDPLTATVTVNPLHGVITLNADGSFHYAPVAYYAGVDSLIYKACDPAGLCDTAKVIFTIRHVNNPPVADPDTYNLQEDDTLTIPVATGVQANDGDVDGDGLNAQTVQQPRHGQMVLQPDGSFTYIPNPNYNGRDTLIYLLCDTGSPTLCDTAIVFFNIAPVADTPVAVNDQYVMQQGTTLNMPVATGVLVNDYDVDGVPLNATVVAGPTNGTLVLDPDGSFNYTPNTAFTGTETFTYQACTAGGLCDTATVTITVTATPPPPVSPTAVDDNYTTTQDTQLQTPAATGVLVNDVNPDNTSLSATVLTLPAHGRVVMQPDGSFVYTPTAMYSGTDLFTYQACNTHNRCSFATVHLTITAVNYPPVALDDAATTPQRTAVVIDVLANDTDPETTTLSSSLVTSATHGTVVHNADNTFTYTPEDGFSGQDYFVYQACDNGGQCATANVVINVTKVNRAPVANWDAYTINEATRLTIPAPGTTVNDTDPDGDALQATLVTDVQHGLLVFQVDGTFTYQPTGKYNGLDSFVYKVCDPSALCDTAIVRLRINPVNDPPVAVNDAFTVREDTVITFPPSVILSNDSDPDGDVLTGHPIGNLQHGSYVLNPDGTYTYRPAPDFNGVDSIYYQVCDPYNACDTGLIKITVLPVDDPPIAVPDFYSVPEDSSITVAGPGVLVNDHDVDDANLVARVVTLPKHGVISLDAGGGFTYTPARYFHGNDTLTYQVCDPSGECNTALVVITVIPLNNPPVAVNDSYSGTEDQALTIPGASGVKVNDSDPDGDPLTASIKTPPAHGGVILKIDGSFVYTPDSYFNGDDAFTYTLCDNGSPTLCTTAKVFLHIAPVPNPPVANPDSVTLPEDSMINVPATGVTGNDLNVDGGPLSVSLVQTVTNGSLVFNADGSFSYRPNRLFRGRDSLVYRVCNQESLCATATVYIIVTPVNHPPVAKDDYYILPEDTVFTFDPNDALLNDMDPDGDRLIATTITKLKHGTFQYNPDGTITYTPEHNYVGLDSIQYKACDPYGACDTAWIKIVLMPRNDAPLAVDDRYTLNENATLSIPAPGFLVNDSDPDGDKINAALLQGTKHGRLIVNGDNAAFYVPDTYFYGQDTAQYYVYDPSGARDTAWVIFTVLHVNNPPVANGNVYSLPQDSLMNGNVLTNDSDPDGDPLTVTIVDQPVNGGDLTLNADGTFHFEPLPGFTGTVTFTYKACDNGSPQLCDTALLTFIVIPAARPPKAVNDTLNTKAGKPVTGKVLANDTDPDGNPITAQVMGQPPHGTVTLKPDGSITYTPATGYSGRDSVYYQVCDNGTPQQCDTAMVLFLIQPPTPPQAENDTIVTKKDTPVNGNVLTNDDDPDGNPLTAQPIGNPQHGIIKMLPDGSFTYTPAPGYGGADSVYYEACNNGSPQQCDTAVLHFLVDLRALKAVNDTVSVEAGNTVNGQVLANDSTDGTVTVTQKTMPVSGQVVLRNDGTFIYAPNPDFDGVDSFQYRICNEVGCDSATVYITVTIRGIKIPNTFTPNGDGRNEMFRIKGIEKYPNSTLYIYNRWGNLVYQDKNYQNTWTANGLNEGTYYYLLLLNTTEGEKAYKGWVLIIR